MAKQRSYAMDVSKKHSEAHSITNKNNCVTHSQKEMTLEPMSELINALGMVTEV